MFYTISIDIVGSFLSSTLVNVYLIVAIDKLTKWNKSALQLQQTVLNTAKFIYNNIIIKHICLYCILTDNSTNFIGSVILKLNKLIGICGILSNPYHPKTNSIAEQVNSSLINIIRKLAFNN